MHLEKVTTRSSEAGLAGWIASNDVTLFTMALVMVIAISLHARLNKGAEQQRSLSQENAEIAATLTSTADELDSARDLLVKSQDALQLTQTERDQLHQQLVEKLAALAEVNGKLEALLADKGRLEQLTQSLSAEKASLSREHASLAGDRETLTKNNSSLRERLDRLATQLAQKVDALRDVEAQRDRLAKQAAELDDIVAALKLKLKELNVDLVAAREEDAAAEVASQRRIEELASAATAGEKQAEDYLAQLKRATALLQSLQSEKQQLQNQLSAAEQRRQAELLAEAENNRELVGLKGPLRRVAILIDASGSMRQASATGGDRWAEAQAIAATWLRHLNVGECVLIVYSSRVRTFPDDGTLADLRGPQGRSHRDALLQQLSSVAPGGWTNTLDALHKAYEYDVDTILLFSDGAPSRDASGVYDDALAQEIYRLCRAHGGIPVNTIGLGNYFDAQTSTFLRAVARLTGGAFRGE